MNVTAPVVLYVFDSLKIIGSYESRVCEWDYIGWAVCFCFIKNRTSSQESFNHKCDYTAVQLWLTLGCVVYI